ncbi:SDR family oxidoreductase [Jeotgalibacillus terrae]|uniref:SDR family oxidoreductase n=1 Tax=Jeotgalibacillus terrae TaxID=587735 RepID=A0ABW5ZFU0_9BACL|nr:SDR family oxidoreductase [Jeotgalibacillus terrae]MBM7579321.1 NAD(P)-dependent dehydrogenase (short-subunit alcohol dehydrogenase family) [Jeotgalibacillus terrae]
MKTALVTGANSGMGLTTTIELVKQGYHVVMMCRNTRRGKVAWISAKEQTRSEELTLMQCDLGSLESIRNFAEEFKSKFSKLDVLVNNAGVVSVKRRLTDDRFESHLGVNHLGHFLLTNLLLEELKASDQGRVVTVSSGAHKWGKIDFDDPHFEKGYNVAKAYGRSKLANILFTKALAKRLEGTNVTANAVHPGAVSTNLGIDRKTEFGKSVHKILKPFFQSAEEGAATTVYLATAPELKDVTGKYFYQMEEIDVSEDAANEWLAEELWGWSEERVGI